MTIKKWMLVWVLCGFVLGMDASVTTDTILLDIALHIDKKILFERVYAERGIRLQYECYEAEILFDMVVLEHNAERAIINLVIADGDGQLLFDDDLYLVRGSVMEMNDLEGVCGVKMTILFQGNAFVISFPRLHEPNRL